MYCTKMIDGNRTTSNIVIYRIFLCFQATILCDIVVLYVLKGKDVYKKKKYLEVMGDDAYKVLIIISK